MKQALWLVFAVGLGCASSSANRESTIPEAGRASWSACRRQVEAYCHNLGHGDPTTESQCERDTLEQYAALTADDARRAFLRSHGCAEAP